MDDVKSEIRDGMRIDWDAPIAMDDGLVLRADVFRPPADGRYPVILSYGPYGKGLAFQEGNKSAWDRLVAACPEVLAGSTNKYQNWELVDPEKWVPDGYAIVRVDSRGAGRSPGFMDPWSPRETLDLYHCIEWAGVQRWSSGKVGMNGISYYAMNAWQVACLEPPHLAAICVWEGSGDYYREGTHHGGIVSQFFTNLFPRAIIRVQHGLGERGLRSQVTGETVCGPETLPDEVLAKNRIDIEAWIDAHPLDDEAHRERSPVWDKVKVPFLSAANWGGQGLHTRGNFEGFVNAASKQKWLEVHGGTHWETFYASYGEKLQKRFFGYFLKNQKNGWDSQPRVQLQMRYVDGFVERHENEWPLARTQWTRFYLDPLHFTLDRHPSTVTAKIDYDALGDGVMFLLPPQPEDIEITGPIAAKLFVSASTADADIFLTLRVFTPDLREITFHGTTDPRTPVGIGWLRASHRKLDQGRSLPYRPYHTHDEIRSLKPYDPVELDIEIWPTCVQVPKGYRIGLSIRGKDYHYPGPPIEIPGIHFPMTGVSPFWHDNPNDRPVEIFGGTNSLYFGPSQQPYLLLPIVPPRQ